MTVPITEDITDLPGAEVLDQIPAPTSVFEAAWDEEWEANLLAMATTRVKKRVEAETYQIFDLHVTKGWPVLRVTKLLQINPASVYLAKHRVSKLLKEEVAWLREKPLASA